MMKFNGITTRKGDYGMTSLADGLPLSKNNPLFDVLGDVDELHSFLGLLKVSLSSSSARNEIDWLEQCMLRIGGMLAVPPNHPDCDKTSHINASDLETLERWQKKIMKNTMIPPLFITLGESERGARADVARTVCRRAERHLVGLIQEQEMDYLGDALKFLNRLSDWLFVKARELNASEAGPCKQSAEE